MQEEDFYKPVNIRDSMFGDIELPEQSKVIKHSSKSNKYQLDQEQDDDNDIDLGFSNLGQVSNIKPNNNKYQSPLSVIKQASDIKKQMGDSLTRPNSSDKQSISEKQQSRGSTIVAKKTTQVRKLALNNRNKKDTKKTTKSKQVIDLDAEIGQVRQWAHRDEQQNQSDFDKSQQNNQQVKVNREIQQQYRRKAQQKVKQLQNKNYKQQTKPMGLAAKAEQLRKKNQQENLLNKQNGTLKGSQKPLNQNNQHQISTDNLVLKENKQKNKKSTNLKEVKMNQKSKQDQNQQNQDDDPWQKVNQKTKQSYQKKIQLKQNAEPMSKEHIIQFYSKKFIFVQEDLEAEFQIDDLDDEQVPGCWQSIFGCFKSDKNQKSPDKKTHKNTKDRTAMRLLAISKINVSNTDEQFFVFKEIWQRLTAKKFARYGNHWNQIGFQGRDPATDLRSTGFLSLLQWYIFIQQHTEQAKQIFNWTLQFDFPLALTHIKGTGLFLKLLKTGKIKSKNWNDFQKYYNCIIINTFKKIKQSYNQSDNVGQVVDKNLEKVRKSLSQYYSQYQKSQKK